MDHRYLRIQDLRRLRHLAFASRRPVEGLYAGRHASPQRGQSVEFSDYRPYLPGDELADIDWKVFARSDRLFVRIFEHQTQMTVHLLVDGSASMNYPLRPPLAASRSPAPPNTLDTKYDHACRLAAAIAFLSTRQQDRVSFTLARGGLRRFVPPVASFTGLNSILTAMEAEPPADDARVALALDALLHRTGRRGLLILLSDLYEPPDPILQSLSAFTQRGFEAVVFHVLHPHELSLPDLGDAVFTDAESGQRIALDTAEARDAYRRRVGEFIDTWAAALRARGIDHALASTSTPYEKSLERYLLRRPAQR